MWAVNGGPGRPPAGNLGQRYFVSRPPSYLSCPFLKLHESSSHPSTTDIGIHRRESLHHRHPTTRIPPSCSHSPSLHPNSAPCRRRELSPAVMERAPPSSLRIVKTKETDLLLQPPPTIARCNRWVNGLTEDDKSGYTNILRIARALEHYDSRSGSAHHSRTRPLRGRFGRKALPSDGNIETDSGF